MREIGPGCIWRYYIGPIACRTGYTERQVERCLRELETALDARGLPARWIVRDGPVCWIRNGLRWDPTVKLTNKKHREGILRALRELPRLQIVLEFCDYYNLPKPFESPGKGNGKGLGIPIRDFSTAPPPSPSPSPKKTESESEVEGSERATGKAGAASPPGDPPRNGNALDPALKAILDECPHLSLVNVSESAGFWDDVLAACEPYGVADAAWLGARLRKWNRYFAARPQKRSRERKYLESRLFGWLTKDLEAVARSPA
jgi:hypothetical protein